jgi:hypothetical protein
VSLLYDNRPVPSYVRTRIGVPQPRIEFGAPSKLDEPGGYRYEISEKDRTIFGQAVRDAESGDFQRQAAARHALTTAFGTVPGFGFLLSAGGRLVMNLLGYGLAATSQGGGGTSFSGVGRSFSDSDQWPWEVRSAVTRARWEVVDGTAYLEITAASTVAAWESGPNNDGSRYWRALSGVFGVENFRTEHPVNVVKQTSPTAPTVPGTFTLKYSAPCGSGPYRFVAYDSIESPGPNADYLSDTTTDSTAHYFGPDLLSCEAGALYDELFEGELENLEPLPNDLDPGDSGITPEQMREQVLPPLRDSEWFEKYYDPPLEDHPKNPNWPCLPPGPQTPTPEVPRAVISGPGFRVPRPPGFDPPGGPGDEMCIVIGGRRQCGKIRRMPPPGEDIIVERPPYRDERFTKDWCPKKGTLIVNLVKQLAKELGFDPGESGWIVDTDCKKRWPGGCFRKGSSKFDAMWRLADMCGATFNTDPPHIGSIKPFPPDPRTYGPYHEHRDFFLFEATQDDLDIPSHIEVYVPHYPGQRGYSVIIEVDTPYQLKDKYLRIRAPKGMSEAAAMDWAAKKARQYEIIASLTDYAIPYEQGQYVQQRTQMKLRIPSEGYDGRFMVWEFVHDIDIGDGAATKIRGVELSRERYAPRFESYEQVWQGVMS